MRNALTRDEQPAAAFALFQTAICQKNEFNKIDLQRIYRPEFFQAGKDHKVRVKLRNPKKRHDDRSA